MYLANFIRDGQKMLDAVVTFWHKASERIMKGDVKRMQVVTALNVCVM